MASTSLTAPLASAASSISVGLNRLPLTLIIASSRPRKRISPSSPRTARSPDQTAVPPYLENEGAGLNRSAVRCGVVPIAMRDERAGVNQLALLARRGLAAVFADDHHFGEGDCLCRRCRDARRPAPDRGWSSERPRSGRTSDARSLAGRASGACGRRSRANARRCSSGCEARRPRPSTNPLRPAGATEAERRRAP